MTFFSAGPAPAAAAPLTRRPSKFTNPADRLARPQQQPVAQRPQRVVSQPPPSTLSPGGQAPQVRPQEGSGPRQGRTKVQQVPLPGAWPGPSAQRQSTQPPSSHVNRRASKSEDSPLPPLPQGAGPKEEFVPSILRPGGPPAGGPPRTVVQPNHETRAPDVPVHERHQAATPSPPIANGTAAHHHTMPSNSDAYNTYPTHHPTHQATLPFPGSPIPQAHIHSSSPQPQPQSQPNSHHLASYSTQGPHGGVFSPPGHATAQPSPQAQPEITHTQYHTQPQPQPPPQQHQQVQHSPRLQSQPQGGQAGRHGSPHIADNHPAHYHVANPSPPSPGQSYFATSSPTPPQTYVATSSPTPPQPYVATSSPTPPHSYFAAQITSPPIPSHIMAQSPPPIPHAQHPNPASSPRLHSASPSPGAPVPPTHQYVTPSSPVPPSQPYAAIPVAPAQPYTAPTVSPAQSYVSPMGSVLSPPPQTGTPSPPMQPYISTQPPAFPLPTSPPPMPSHGPSYAPAPAFSFPVPSIPVSQPAGYFETVTPAPFTPFGEPDLPDPYLLRRYQAPLPLPQGAPRRQSPGPSAKPMPVSTPPSYSAATTVAAAGSSSARRGEGRNETEDERAAREWQRWEEESARARREQEEKDEELARSLDMELNMSGGGAASAAQGEPDRPSRTQLPRLSTGVVGNSSEW